VRPSLVDAVINAVGVGVGVDPLLLGPSITPPNASVVLESTTMAAKQRHRFIGFKILWWSSRCQTANR